MKPQREHVRSLSSGIGDSVEITRAYNPDQNCTEYRAELVGIDGIQPTAHGSNEGDALRNLYTRIDELKESGVIA